MTSHFHLDFVCFVFVDFYLSTRFSFEYLIPESLVAPKRIAKIIIIKKIYLNSTNLPLVAKQIVRSQAHAIIAPVPGHTH